MSFLTVSHISHSFGGRQILEDVPLSSYEVISWIESYLREQYEAFS